MSNTRHAIPVLIMNQKTKIITALSIVLLLALVFVFTNQGFLKKSQPTHLINCDMQQGPCTRHISDHTITLDILPKPVRTMDNLTFKVDVQGPIIKSKPHIDLSMPGMDMGLNWVFLNTRGMNNYEGSGVLIKCPTGQTIWRATVTLPEIGTAEFYFEILD